MKRKRYRTYTYRCLGYETIVQDNADRAGQQSIFTGVLDLTLCEQIGQIYHARARNSLPADTP